MEFKSNDSDTGQIRVYLLPDDVSRTAIDRQPTSLRRLMQLLLSQLDTSKETWKGAWNVEMPVIHLDSSLDGEKQSDTSLFEIFNTLPSPNPNPEIVANRYARAAMYDILDSNIDGLTTSLYMYQRRSAAMMLQREAHPSQFLDPRLRELTDHNGRVFYYDSDAGSCLREPRNYESSKGGICAENMGLGKTLISLALILATKGMASQIPIEYSVGTMPIRKSTGSLLDMAAANIARNGIPWKDYFDLKNADGYQFSQCTEAIQRNRGYYFLSMPVRRHRSRIPRPDKRKIWLTGATIVVVPANLVKQWVHEISKHTSGLKVLIMNNNKHQVPLAEELIDYDIILFSKQRFDKEAHDGSDESGRRTSTPIVCHCPYIGSSRTRNCTCFKEEHVYRSPLKDLHFKRLITDEGHTFGNASKSSITEAATVVQFLQVTSRWIVSGTPTQGLYGAETSMVTLESASKSSSEENDNQIRAGGKPLPRRLSNIIASDDKHQFSKAQEMESYKQERKDLEKLGNIATVYLQVRPWANTTEDNGMVQWSQHVMLPRHGLKSHGNIHCLRSTLEGMIIRHRPEDVEKDVVLPPLHQTIVSLDGSFQDKMSLNLFSMMIVSNAITSERKDADYFFHPRQRAALDLLVKNLRQASFYWSGFTLKDVESTIDVAKDFLEKEKMPIEPEDKIMLQEVIKVGEMFISNRIKEATSRWHEMPMYVQNTWPENTRAAWSLDGNTTGPTLMGTTMVHDCQKFVEAQLWKEDPSEGLEEAGTLSLDHAFRETNRLNATKHIKDSNLAKKHLQSAPILAGGVTVATGDGPSPMKRARNSSIGRWMPSLLGDVDTVGPVSTTKPSRSDQLENNKKSSSSKSQNSIKPKSAMKKSSAANVAGTLNPASPLASTTIISTSSAKLTYLMQRITVQHETEKILVFYESDNVAYYIAQALECLHIKHLIYAKSLPPDRKSRYVVTFNQTETFRVLLMDISQAAFGLDMSSASRVYFVNPVFSPQVEAQAVKRAHRIGQKKPVFVETLVLKGGIEEVILERRKDMSNEEHNKCKNILNDQKIFDWIRNVRFIPLPTDDIPGPEQMAKLDTPELVFGRSAGSKIRPVHDPDADLVIESRSINGNYKHKATVNFDDKENTSRKTGVANGKRKVGVVFAESHAPSSPEHNRSEESSITGKTMFKDSQGKPDNSADVSERFSTASEDRFIPTFGDYLDVTDLDTRDDPRTSN